MTTRPAQRGLESPRKQVKYFLLYHGPTGQGARAFGIARHETKERLAHGRDVSVGKIHAQRTMAAYLQGATAFAEWAAAQYGVKSVPEQLKHPDWGRAWLAALQGRGLAPKTLGAYLTAVLKLVEVVCPGRRARWLALRADLPPTSAPGNRAWLPDEAARLIHYVAARDPELGLALRLLDATGARVHEVLSSRQHWHHALHVGQVGDGVLSLIGKGGKARLVTVPPALATELAAWVAGRPPQALVFAAESARLYGLLRRGCAALGMRRDGLHALRYGYVQREHAALVAAGTDQEIADALVSQRIGHVRPRITRRYLARG